MMRGMDDELSPDIAPTVLFKQLFGYTARTVPVQLFYKNKNLSKNGV
jgi:hypothetical protein